MAKRRAILPEVKAMDKDIHYLKQCGPAELEYILLRVKQDLLPAAQAQQEKQEKNAQSGG